MLALSKSAPPVHPAIVSRRTQLPQPHDSYLLVTPDGATDWIDDPERATAFSSMREAARMALRLPSRLRAYGLPRGTPQLHS